MNKPAAVTYFILALIGGILTGELTEIPDMDLGKTGAETGVQVGINHTQE